MHIAYLRPQRISAFGYLYALFALDTENHREIKINGIVFNYFIIKHYRGVAIFIIINSNINKSVWILFFDKHEKLKTVIILSLKL